MIRYLKIAKMGNPVLRKTSEPLDTDLIPSADVQKFIALMKETMREEMGVGLAAPQVYENVRIFVLDAYELGLFHEANEYITVINPIITPLTNEKIGIWEGCLSVPGLRGYVLRTKKILLSGYNEKGEFFNLELDGLPSIAAQHEYDHLEGILYVDKVEEGKIAFIEEYEKYWV